MPYRHEFEQGFNDDAETLLDALVFDPEIETIQSLEPKLQLLVCYSLQASDRELHHRVAEDLGIQYTLDDGFPGVSVVEQRIDALLRPLVPYFGAEKTRRMSELIRDGGRLWEMIRMKEWWNHIGVQTEDEGYLFMKLANLTVKGELPQKNVAEWNRQIEEYRDVHRFEAADDANVLTPTELGLCRNNGIDCQFYLDVKDLIIREATIRGGLTRDQAVAFDPTEATHIGLIYDHCLRSGWII
jgi:hypothetical protein